MVEQKVKKSDITKEKILQAAEYEFAQKGLYGARVDDIAARAEVNKRMIYVYFESKENLYSVVLGRVYERLTKRETELLGNLELDGEEAIKQIIHMYFNFLATDPSFVKMVMWENLNEASYVEKSEAVNLKEPVLNVIAKLLSKGIEKGVFREDIDVMQVALSMNLFSFAHFSNAYTMGHILHMDLLAQKEVEKRMQHVTEVILSYIRN